jgi:hypothetical protein
MKHSTTRALGALITAAGFLAAASPALAQRGPAAAATQLSGDVLALACAPTAAIEEGFVPLRVTGGQDSFVRRIYSPGDLVTINAGTDNGIEVGQEYYARRVKVDHRRVGVPAPASVQTAGWLRIWAVDDRMSLATITHACDTIEVGDYLQPFVLPDVPVAASNKPKAERDNYGRVSVGTDLRRSFGKGDFFILNRGADFGITPGAQFVVYRDKKQTENFLYELGEAVAVQVGPASATLQVTLSRDAFSEGDYVAMRK